RLLTFEQAVDEEGETEDREEPADAHAGAGLSAGDGDHEEKADSDGEQHDAGPAVTRRTGRPLDPVVAVHGAIEAAWVDLGRRHEALFDHRNALANLELTDARPGHRRRDGGREGAKNRRDWNEH